MESPLGFQIYPYASVNGEIVKWNGVIYDLRNPQVRNGKKHFKFVKLVPARPSPDEVRELATQIIHDMLRPR